MTLGEPIIDTLIWLWKAVSAGFIALATYVWHGLRHDHSDLRKAHNELKEQVNSMKIAYATKSDMKDLKDELKVDLSRVEDRLERIETKYDARFDGVQAQLTAIAVAVKESRN
jgi:hypothetical protein